MKMTQERYNTGNDDKGKQSVWDEITSILLHADSRSFNSFLTNLNYYYN